MELWEIIVCILIGNGILLTIFTVLIVGFIKRRERAWSKIVQSVEEKGVLHTLWDYL